MADTRYVVLEQDAGSGDWSEIAAVSAPNHQAAIRAALADTATHGRYVAVPARSWKPVQVTAVQTTTLKLEQPS